jgi:hypothetical protein
MYNFTILTRNQSFTSIKHVEDSTIGETTR